MICRIRLFLFISSIAFYIIQCQVNEPNYEFEYDAELNLMNLFPKNKSTINSLDTIQAIIEYKINRFETLDTVYELWLGFRSKDADEEINDWSDWKKIKNSNAYYIMNGISSKCTLSIPIEIIKMDTSIVWPLDINIIMTTQYDCEGYCEKIVGRIEDIYYYENKNQ